MFDQKWAKSPAREEALRESIEEEIDVDDRGRISAVGALVVVKAVGIV